MVLLRRSNPRLKTLLVLEFVLCFLCSLCSVPTMAQTAAIPEYRVKATFLLQFAQFVDWPPKVFSGAQTPLVIGVLGEDPFGNFLDETVRGETVERHALAVQRYRRVEEIKNCQVLFVSRSEESRLEEIAAVLKGRNILMVGDGERFAYRGGMIQFVTEANKIRLRINLDAARAANLTISSKLLRLATVIKTGGN